MGLHRESPHLWGPGSAPHLRTCISHLRTCLSHQHKGQFPLTRCRDRAQSCMFHIRMLWEKRSSGRKGFLVTVTQGRSYQRKPHSCTHCRAPARPPRGRTGLGSDPVWLSAGVLPAPPASPETMRGLTCRVAVVPGHGFGDVVPGTGAADTGRGVRTRRSTAGRPPLPAPTACPLGRPHPNQPLPDARRSPPLAREPRCLIRAHRRHRQAFVEGTNEWMDEWMDGWELLPPSSGLRGPQPCDSRGSGSVRGCFGWTAHADPCGSTRQMGAPFPSQVSRSSAALRCSQERPPSHTHTHTHPRAQLRVPPATRLDRLSQRGLGVPGTGRAYRGPFQMPGGGGPGPGGGVSQSGGVALLCTWQQEAGTLSALPLHRTAGSCESLGREVARGGRQRGLPRHVGGHGVGPRLAARPLRGLWQVPSHLPASASCKVGVRTAPPSHSGCDNSASTVNRSRHGAESGVAVSRTPPPP